MILEQSNNLAAYLACDEHLDWNTRSIGQKAAELAIGCTSPTGVAAKCFYYVRDEIKHSGDHQLDPVTCRASDVLRHGTGWCYAKSHLLAALLRANQIPTGLCYQRLSVQEAGPPYCLHGLNAIHLPGFGWRRVDARGNKEGVCAEFSPPSEQLAFTATDPGEFDLPEIWASPHPAVICCLSTCTSHQQVLDNLPDVPFVH